MRILFIDRSCADSIWTVVTPVTEKLLNEGHKVCWVSMVSIGGANRSIPPEGTEVIELSVSRDGFPCAWILQMVQLAPKLRKVIKSWRPDVVHTHFAVPGMVARWVAKRAGCKVVSTQHEMFGSMNFLLRAGVRLSERYTDVITYVSKTVATSYGENDVAVLEVSQRVVPHRIVVYNSIDFSEVEKAVQASGERDENKVICVGRMVPEKGQASLLEAWSGVLQSRPEMQLHFIGSGPDEGKLKRRADELEVSQSVHFHGWVTKPEALRQMATAGLVVQPSEHEGFGLSLAEAMATGTPVLVSDIAVFREVVGEHAQGVHFFPVQDVKALSRSIVSEVNNDFRVIDRGLIEGVLRQRFSNDMNAGSYMSVYQCVTSE